MAYRREICTAGDTVEIKKYYTFKVHPKGEQREPKRETSQEWQKRSNRRKRAETLRRLINCNFYEGDYFITLTYRKDLRPGTREEMQEDIAKYIRAIRAIHKRAGAVLKYIYVREVGARGAAHVHILIQASERVTASDILGAWEHGSTNLRIINNTAYGEEPGQYRAIAEYLLKASDRTEESEGITNGKGWQSSHNLTKPALTRETITKAEHFNQAIPNKKGFHIDKNSISIGISELTGYPYICYTYIKDQERGDTSGKRRRRKVGDG